MTEKIKENTGVWGYGMETFMLSIRKLNGMDGYNVHMSAANHVTEQSNHMSLESIENFSNSLAAFVEEEKKK